MEEIQGSFLSFPEDSDYEKAQIGHNSRTLKPFLEKLDERIDNKSLLYFSLKYRDDKEREREISPFVIGHCIGNDCVQCICGSKVHYRNFEKHTNSMDHMSTIFNQMKFYRLNEEKEKGEEEKEKKKMCFESIGYNIISKTFSDNVLILVREPPYKIYSDFRNYASSVTQQFKYKIYIIIKNEKIVLERMGIFFLRKTTANEENIVSYRIGGNFGSPNIDENIEKLREHQLLQFETYLPDILKYDSIKYRNSYELYDEDYIQSLEFPS